MQKFLKSFLLTICIFNNADCAEFTKLSPNTLIPRSVLLAKADRFFVQLSPNGKYVSYFARSGNDVELRIDRADNGKTIRSFKVRNCRNMYKYCWSYTNKHILLPQDNFGDENDLVYLKSFSPLFRMNKIKKPLIVFQGENDPRVNKVESEYIVSALKKRKAPVTYILYSDEGHGFRREPSIKSYMAFTEKFLARFLGGWHEPIGKDELKGSNHEILEGKEILGVE